MAHPTSRALRLLALLQTHRSWTGRELRQRLDVSARTLRRDIDRLREMGYEVSARPGVEGGYRLDSSERLPPLLLEDEEAVAIAVALRVAAVALGEEAALGALVKLEQMLAPHLRRRVKALQEFAVPSAGGGAQADVDTIAELALACRDQERVRFRYVSALDEQSSRQVEPHTLVAHESRWYLVCWDQGREDWRTFRVDRMSQVLRTGARFETRELPVADPTELVVATTTDHGLLHEGTVHLDIPLDEARRIFGVWATGSSSNADGGTDWPVGGSSTPDLVYGPAWVPPEVDWTFSGTAEARARLRTFGQRLIKAVDGGRELPGAQHPGAQLPGGPSD